MKKKICFITNSELFFECFLSSHLLVLSKYFNITVVCDISKSKQLKEKYPTLNFFHIPVTRKKISFFSDIILFLKILCFLYRNNFFAVHSFTPKIGLITLCAAFVIRRNNRIHTFTGQIWATKNKMHWKILRFFDKCIFWLANYIFSDSPSQSYFLLNEGFLNKNIPTLGNGSIAGVDLKKFSFKKAIKKNIRANLNIPNDSFVLIFTGRICLDKGVLDLIKAFKLLNDKNTFLLFVGDIEDDVKDLITFDDRVLYLGYQKDTSSYLIASDLFCMPSYREGFGSSIIEAAAVGLPSIGSNIIGITDAIQANITGLLHKPKDPEDIVKKIKILKNDQKKYLKFSNAAKIRCHNLYSNDFVTKCWVKFYKSLL
tara:strand:- start:1286 stop:2398 length:1113 start_codon:yes stop_codon:yes gene_type:complete